MRSPWSSLLIPLALAACGDVVTNHTYNDAGPQDASPDAAPDAAVPGVVQVTVYDYVGNLAVGSPVLFLDAADHVVADVVTDANGVAMATMLAGGSVTALMLPPPAVAPLATPLSNATLYTFADIKPGDKIVVGAARSTGTATTLNVTVPRHPTATQYVVQSACSGAGLPQPAAGVPITLALSIDPSCPTPGIEVEAQDVNGAAIAIILKADLVPTGTSLDLSAETYVPNHVVVISATNLPSSVNTVRIFDEQSKGPFHFSFPYAQLTLSGNSASGPASFATAGTKVLERFSVIRPGAGQILNRVIAEPSSSETIDVGAQLIPWILAKPVYDVDRNDVTWTEASGGGATGVYAEVVVASPAGGSFFWEVLAKYTPGGLRLPKLSGSYAAYVIDPTETVTPNVTIERWPAGGWELARLRHNNTYYGYLLEELVGATPDPNQWVATSSYAGR